MDNTYQHLLVQITNLARMINNLSNRLNIVETATVNTQNQRSNLNTQLSPMEQELFNSLNTPRSRNNTTNTFSHKSNL